jgi:hypothetical protein
MRGRRAPDRDGHVSLHGRRRVDEAPRRARERGLRGRSRRAPNAPARGVRRARRDRSRHAGRRVLLRVHLRTRRRRLRPRCAGTPSGHSDPCSHGPALGRGARRRRPLPRPRRPSRGACGRRRTRRSGAALADDHGAARARRRPAARPRRAAAQGFVGAPAPPPARRHRLSDAQDAAPNEPADPRDAVSRPPARARGNPRARSGHLEPAADADRPGRNREDAARAAARRRAGRRLSRWRLLGSAGSTPRRCARSLGDRTGARSRGGGPDRPHAVDRRRGRRSWSSTTASTCWTALRMSSPRFSGRRTSCTC